MLNRTAVTVRVRQPFLEWLRQLPDPVKASTTLASLNDEPTTYLIEICEDDSERAKGLRRYFDLIFESELAGWWTNEEDWPAKRTFAVFQKWFEVTWLSVIEDLVDAPLHDDD